MLLALFFTSGRMVVISFAINVNREIAPSQNVACKKDLQPGRTARNQTAAQTQVSLPVQTLGDHSGNYTGKTRDLLKSIISVENY